MTTVALVLTLSILAGLALMQILLISGLPLGNYGWGGQHPVLPPRLRVASAVAILLYAGFAVLVMGRAGILPGRGTRLVIVATWVLFAYSAVSIVMNAISRSRQERIVQTPVSVLLTVGVLIIAAGPTA
ncbi:hypothetical protein [Plantactinospora soyae]|uniref:Uncharacterized protein n=1 Tax=Plantactinospora soyae TaxID=1544732 RepID=A0A927R148_9ACTN|nr:hypothetical protein [Plantactinospora soyae]MBE1490952.1 hypothetical protein [Plantactinospora soyae]